MRFLILLCFIAPFADRLQAASGNAGDGDRTRRGGPRIDQPNRMPDISPHEVLALMFQAMEKVWLVAPYQKARSVRFRGGLDATLPLASLDRRVKAGDASFDLKLEGTAAPNGRYRAHIQGGLGSFDMVDDLRRRFLSSEDFRAFAEAPRRARSRDANLTNYRSFLARHLSKLRASVLESGAFRSVYVGTGEYEGWEVDIIRVYKPQGKVRINQKAPISLRRLWTFWQAGGYEVWVYRTTRLPAVVFYTNVNDNIYANLEIDYDQAWMPKRVIFRNNSLKSEGEGDLLLTYAEDQTVNGISFKFRGENGLEFRLDSTLDFLADPSEASFRISPPYGFRKLNHDHLKLMVLTQISGALLKLKQSGVNLKNFKF